MVLYGPPAMFAPPAEKLANQDHQNENKPDDEEEKKKQVAGESPSSTAIILHPSPSPADAAPKPPASEEGYGPSQLPAVDAASFPAAAAETPELKAAACRSVSSPSSSSSGATFSLSLAPTSAISSPTVAYSTQGQLIGTSPADREATMTLEEALRSETPLILRAEQDAELQQLLARYQALTEQLLAHPEQQPELQQLAVQVSRLHEGARSGPPFASESMTLGHFMQHHFGDDTRFYLQQLPIHQFDPLLAYFGEQVRSVPFGIAAKELMCGMFAGGPGITTSLHYDRKHFDHGEAPVSNIFVQVSGTKRFELLHPSHSPALYARGQPLPASACRPGSTGLQAAGMPEDLLPAPIASSPHVSRLGKIDAATFSSPEATSAWPGFADAYSQRIVVELSPGDCLYLPPRWWHATFSTSSGTALNWWFTPLPHASS